ncbi:MAG: CRISPR-associated helicase Cas3' [Endomicrobium sp.]|nr:CRISPR-associated helicase Cas3' [Endomicrobium sp.]
MKNAFNTASETTGASYIMKKEIYAHSANSNGEWQLLADHLANVAAQSSKFAEEFDSSDWAYNIGLLHDLGKASDDFQKYLKKSSNEDSDEDGVHVKKTNHSGAGAIFAVRKYNDVGKILAYCIAGHHAGLRDWDGGPSSIKHRLSEKGDKKYFDEQVEKYVKSSFIDLKNPLKPPALKKRPHDLHLWLRMLYSCLVDADFIDTENHINCGQKDRGNFDSISELSSKFFRYMKKYDNPQTDLNKIRIEILRACEQKATDKEGFFELTVPTGGGKTLSSVAFAFGNALEFGKKRIIYVIPYTSIIEQTSKILGDIFGEDNVIEHHSNIDPGKETEKSRLACENWDAPVIVTTNVQFFESLYANRSSDCRKLHNIINSVIILDEAQILPTELLYPVEDIMRQLVDNYKCSIVFSTATQPYFKNIKYVEKIIPPSMDLYNKLKRVTYNFPQKDSKSESWEDVAKRLKQYKQVLCVVNTRKDCFNLYKLMPKGSIHLSALMCAEHRSKKIALIKEKLKNNEEIIVISTQLIEAGVDIDFPVVFRAFTGLPSIVQTAGRCNREGNLEIGEVFVFNPPTALPVGLVRKSGDTTKEMMYDDNFNIGSSETSKKFFELLISKVNSVGDDELKEQLINDAEHGHFQFASYAKKFNIIDDKCNKTIIVSYDDKSKNLLKTLKYAGISKNLMRSLQRYTVNIPSRMFDEIRAKGLLEEIQDGIFAQDTTSFYKDDVGLAIYDENYGLDEWNI